MALNREFNTAVAAGQAGIRINTDEIVDAVKIIEAACKKRHHKLTFWDKAFVKGDCIPAMEPSKSAFPGMPPGPPPPVTIDAILRQIIADKTLRNPDDSVVYVATNFHLALEGPQREETTALTQHAVAQGKKNGQVLVLLMPGEVKLPPELAPLFHVIEHELPEEQELMEILLGCCTTEQQKPSIEVGQAAVKAALGLTRLQAEGAFASSLVLKQKIDPHAVWEAKAHELATEGLVEIKAPRLGFEDVGGLDGFKDFLKRLLAPTPLEEVDPDARAKGVMCVGPPGVGKSLMAECLGKELGLPTLVFNPGNLMGEFVGVTERNTRRFFQIIRRLAPCIVIGDEIGQQMGGGQPGQQGHQVDARMLGTFLTQMSEVQEPVFWFFTANDISSMHEAFARAERIDAKVYVRLPGPDQLAQVWKIYIGKFFPAMIKGKPNPRHIPLDPGWHLKAIGDSPMETEVPTVVVEAAAAMLMTLPVAERKKVLSAINKLDKKTSLQVDEMTVKDDRWTPAEVRACCRLALRLKMPLHLAAKRVGHICIGPKGDDLLSALDKWAVADGAIDSETGEVFTPEQRSDAKRRRVRGDSENN